ncbi:hypothetical protein AC482_01910 [miscellaneous Crenarchaeota group-15 archaeon DG-45]|uniref:Uncharacterized protein n=1 Tax=miscellaneous Crenarchaeota group-15 archaeon DG-45 TaxID=1685127 RepID=A0A0M0BRP1_9ARCH|nr:MAG: hypothetical protein AC482_01910 [miscellaneous Crenarchaeota group-15 archaeon DG-45]
MAEEEEPVSKVMLDEIDDFKLKAAYRTYSDLFNEADSTEDRLRLNDLISRLLNEEMSFRSFYSELNQYRERSGRDQRFNRTRIIGQRKRAYRRDQQERERIKRHKR